MLVMAALSATSVAQEGGWTHTVRPVFQPPFAELLLPWDADAVTLQPMETCWRVTEPPFRGVDWRFWCYEVPVTARQADSDLVTALQSLGLERTSLTSLPGTWPDPFSKGWVTSYFGLVDGDSQRVEYWVFNAPDGVFVTLATQIE